MFNLIMVIIGIALITLGVMAGQYYLSDGVTDSRAKAESVKYINETEQVFSAITLYLSDGNTLDSDFSLDKLVNQNYLKQIPGSWKEYPYMIGTEITSEDESLSDAVCLILNERNGYNFTPDGISYLASINDSSKGIPVCFDGLDTNIACCIKQD